MVSVASEAVHELMISWKLHIVMSFAQNKLKMGRKSSKCAYLDMILPLKIWMLTEFDHLTEFEISNVFLNVQFFN